MTVLDIDLDNVKSAEDEDNQINDDYADAPAPEATVLETDAQKKKGKAPVTA
jgi:hypothetical protein